MTIEKSELTMVLEHVDKLVNECIVLETKEEALRKKRQNNDREIRLLLLKAKKLSMEAKATNVEDDDENDDPVVEESLIGNNNQERDDEGSGASVEECMLLKNKLLEEIKISGNNLRDHHEVLDTLERENGRCSVAWKNMFKQVTELSRVHRLRV